jgi:hypothetical protein
MVRRDRTIQKPFPRLKKLFSTPDRAFRIPAFAGMTNLDGMGIHGIHPDSRLRGNDGEK